MQHSDIEVQADRIEAMMQLANEVAKEEEDIFLVSYEDGTYADVIAQSPLEAYHKGILVGLGDGEDGDTGCKITMAKAVDLVMDGDGKSWIPNRI